jgi:hypothetical protein
LDIHFQGLNLNCGRYCLEALMRWKHGTEFGAPVTVAPAANANGDMQATYAVPRTAHDVGVQTHIDTWFKIAFNPDNHAAAYGLFTLAMPNTANEWETALRTYGPLIVSGHIGAVRIIPVQEAGHYVLVIGVTADDEVEYLDPLRPWNAFNIGIPSMAVADFNQLANAVTAAAL